VTEGPRDLSRSARHTCALQPYGRGISLAALHLALFAVVTEIVSSFAGAIVVMTGTFAGCARALAVLKELPRDRVEWMTAIGFVMGMAVTLLLVVVDVALEVH
jgi:hypothetical protein